MIMKELSIDEIKKIQLDILCSVDLFCNERGLRYSLAYGTLIGAVRHNGYIPWDDDIDIMMPRNDYDVFVSSFNGVIDNLCVMAPELNWDYYAPYANVYDKRTLLIEKNNSHRGFEIGVKIDIFPMDDVIEEYQEYVKCYNKSKLYNRQLFAKRINLKKIIKIDFKQGIIMLIEKVVSCVLSYHKLQKKIKALTNKSEESKYVDNIVFPVYKLTRIRKEILTNYIKLMFENHEFMAIEKYDIYLKTIYGDYMALPPEEKRVPHHHFKAYWLD